MYLPPFYGRVLPPPSSFVTLEKSSELNLNFPEKPGERRRNFKQDKRAILKFRPKAFNGVLLSLFGWHFLK